MNRPAAGAARTGDTDHASTALGGDPGTADTEPSATGAQPGSTTTTGPGEPPAWEAVVSSIGPKVRDLRQRLGLSLQQLARRADVSAAAIHKVERTDMVPTITTLLKLAGALERPVGYFLGGPADDPPVASFVLADERTVLASTEHVALATITGPVDRFRVAGAVATIEPGAESGTPTPAPGEDLVLVLYGSLRFVVAGEHYTLRRGDALHYPTDRRHQWSNPGRAAARAVWVSVRGS